jgi:hypothetical protein
MRTVNRAAGARKRMQALSDLDCRGTVRHALRPLERMKSLNLPEYDFTIQAVGETRMIFDPVRRRYVALTPEEWVRQHFVQFLIRERGAPRGLIAIEAEFRYNGMSRRADVVVYGRDGKPLLAGECKAPDIEIRQEAFDQLARYNTVVQAKYLVITNGVVHYCYLVDRVSGTFVFLDDLPPYEAL